MNVQELPEEIRLTVFASLPPKDLLVASLVCKEWYHLAQDRSFWRFFSVQQFSHEIQSSVNLKASADVDWKLLYKNRIEVHKRWKKGEAKLTSLRGHNGTVFCVNLLKENTQIASAGDDRAIKIWDVQKGQLEYNIEGNEYGFLSLTYSPENQMIIGGDYQGTVKVWRLNMERRSQLSSMSIRELKDILKAKNISFADCFEKQDLITKILNSRALPTIDPVYSLNAHYGTVIGLHSYKNILASGARDSAIALTDLSNGQLIKKLAGHHNGVNCVNLYDNGTKLASASNDYTAKLWDLEKGEVLKTFKGHGGWVWGLAMNEEIGLMATSSTDATIFLWDTKSATRITTFKEHQLEVAGITADFQNHRLVSASFSGEVHVHDLRMGRLQTKIKVSNNRLTRVAVDHDHLYVASFDCFVRAYDFNAVL
jgi:WD40 repeat protein